MARLATAINTWGKHPAELSTGEYQPWMMYDVMAYNMEVRGGGS